jgi:hypothetical protein
MEEHAGYKVDFGKRLDELSPRLIDWNWWSSHFLSQTYSQMTKNPFLNGGHSQARKRAAQPISSREQAIVWRALLEMFGRKS